jgi:uncharacterized membrane protein
MTGREISERQRQWLVGELTWWQARGILTEAQAAEVLELYGTSEERAERRGARALLTLTSLAALLVGLAVLLLIGYNWEVMPAGVKLALVVAALVGTHAGGFFLRERLGWRTASEVVFFLACLFFGCAIALVAQILHINSDSPDIFWWWALGTLPFAVCLDTTLLHTLFVGLLALYAGFAVLGMATTGRGLFGFIWLPANAAYSVPLLALPGMLWAYRKGSATTLALYVPLLAWWVILQPFAWRFEANPIYFIGCVGGLFLILAECHPEESQMAIPYRFYGALLMGGVLVPLSYYSFHRDIHPAGFTAGVLVEMVSALVVSVLVVAAAGEIDRRAATVEPGQAVSLARVLLTENRRRWLPMGFTLFLAFLAFYQIFVDEPLIPTVLANAAMVALALWLVHIGLREDRGLPFSAGVLYFLLWVVLRYIDLFGDFGGMLGASAMFFLCGATLFGLATYWRKRRVVRHA